MISKTKIKQRARSKTSTELKETLALAVKNSAWENIAKILSGSTRAFSSVNLSKIEEETKAGDTVLIPGKVLSQGDLTKKIKIIAFSASALALEKIKESKSEFSTILLEINKNKKFEGIKLIR